MNRAAGSAARAVGSAAGTRARAVGSTSRSVRGLRQLTEGIANAVDLSRDGETLSKVAPDVSGWSVGMQLEHLWTTERQLLGWIRGALDDPSRAPRQGGPTPMGAAVLVAGWIPRGRGNAPEVTVPDEIGDDLTERMIELHEIARGLVPRTDELHASECTLEHPALGHLSPSQWLRFLDIHHRHHQKIIRDILAD